LMFVCRNLLGSSLRLLACTRHYCTIIIFKYLKVPIWISMHKKTAQTFMNANIG
jgi:hypothetical protein